LKIESVPIEKLTFDPANARKHSDANLAAIAGSLKEFGQRKPIVITFDNVIVAGNGTVEAAKFLGWSDVDVVVVPADWSADQVKAFALADNRSAELAEWNPEVLSAQLLELEQAGFDIEALGFESVAVDEMEQSAEIVEDEVPEAAPVRVALGDIWQLGDHRLMCEDSIEKVNVISLMDNQIADMVFTDPPYGVGYQSNFRTKTKKFDLLKNDNLLLDIAPVISQFNQGWVFVWTSWKVIDAWITQMLPLGFPTNMIIWDKGGGYIGDLEKTFGTDFEIALVWHNGNKLTDKRLGSVWSVDKDASGTYRHPTQKPVGLAAMAITHTTLRNQIVLDLFGGSGSTLIACEQTNRVCYIMELDPKYCDVIIERWETLTGKKAVLENASR
jgi:DNA modification methylase